MGFDVPIPSVKPGLVSIPSQMPYPNNLTAGYVRSSGLLKGTFVHPASSSVTRYFGAILQDYNYGAGFFMGPVNSGKVTFAAEEPEQ